MFSLQTVLCSLLLVNSIAFSSLATAAAILSVSPIQLDLTPNSKTGVITLINKNTTPVNLQLEAKSWDMDENGKFIEIDSDDFIFYPKTLTIAPEQTATIRAGYTGDFPNKEKPFRLIIQEIPEITQAVSEKNKVNVGIVSVLRLSIPVYVLPINDIPVVQVGLGGLKTDKNNLRVGVKNLTGYHINLQKVAVKLLKQNKVLVEKAVELQLQRVLGDRLVFINVPLDVKKWCGQADAIAVQIEANNLKEPYQTTMPLKSGCQL